MEEGLGPLQWSQDIEQIVLYKVHHLYMCLNACTYSIEYYIKSPCFLNVLLFLWAYLYPLTKVGNTLVLSAASARQVFVSGDSRSQFKSLFSYLVSTFRGLWSSPLSKLAMVKSYPSRWVRHQLFFECLLWNHNT
jgi:hypothetical protein